MQLTKTCNTCASYTARPVNTRDEQTGTFKACALDLNHPGARFADPRKPCRLAPVKWTPK